jgi:hypothetical protein
MYTETRGPILLINGPSMKVIMRQRDSTDATPTTQEYIYEKMEQFAATTRTES